MRMRVLVQITCDGDDWRRNLAEIETLVESDFQSLLDKRLGARAARALPVDMSLDEEG